MNDSAEGNRMSAPSGPLKVFVCPGCGEQIELPPGPKGHYCPEVYVEGEGRHFVKAEEVEVIPLAKAEQLEAALKEAAAELRTRARRCRELDPERRGLNRDGHCTAKASAYEHAAELVEAAIAASKNPESTEEGL